MKTKASQIKVHASEKDVALSKLSESRGDVSIFSGGLDQELQYVASNYKSKGNKLFLENNDSNLKAVLGKVSFSFLYKDFVYFGECELIQDKDDRYFLDLSKNVFKTSDLESGSGVDSSIVLDMEKLLNTPLAPVDKQDMEELDSLRPQQKNCPIVYINNDLSENINLETPTLSAFLICSNKKSVVKKYEVFLEDFIEDELCLLIPNESLDLSGTLSIKLIISYSGQREEVFFDGELKNTKPKSDRYALATFTVLDSNRMEVERFFRLHQKRQQQINHFIKKATGTE